MTVPVVLAAVGVGAQRVADDVVGPLHVGVGVLAVGRADDEARAHALDEGAEHLACELGVVVHHERVGKPGAGPQAHVAANDVVGPSSCGRQSLFLRGWSGIDVLQSLA